MVSGDVGGFTKIGSKVVECRWLVRKDTKLVAALADALFVTHSPEKRTDTNGFLIEQERAEINAVAIACVSRFAPSEPGEGGE